jgi:hypothetical protein
MMYVEELLISIQSRMLRGHSFDGLLDDPWYQKFLQSVGNQIQNNKPLSTKQGAMILKLIARARIPIVVYGMATDDDIDEMLRRPFYRQPLYESVHIPREVRYLGDNLLAFRFRQDDNIVQSIKNCELVSTDWLGLKRKLLPAPQFDWDHRLWVVPVWRHNIAALTSLIMEYHFTADQVTIDYLELAHNSLDQSSAFVIHDQDVILANVCDNPLLAGWITEVIDGLVL